MVLPLSKIEQSCRRWGAILVLMLSIVNSSLADKPQKFHNPIKQNVEGWTVLVDPQIYADENQVEGELCLKALANHLQRVKFIVSADRVRQLQQVEISLDWHHELNNFQYHPNRNWLQQNGHDPRLEKHIHIPRARQLIDPRQWAKHPYAILHELAHAYHDQVLSFDHAAIKDTFNAMKKRGDYQDVLNHTGTRSKHYALSNHKEYFAESTEAYFGVNDFYPFVRAELREHDPKMFDLLESIWGKVR